MMSVHTLRSPFTPLPKLPRQHTLSPTSDYFTQSSASTTSTIRSTDPQTRLLQRWQQIAQSLSQTRMSRKLVVALNRNLDEAEHLLSWEVVDNLEATSHGESNFGLGIARGESLEKAMAVRDTTPPDSPYMNAPEDVEPATEGTELAPQAYPVVERAAHLVKELRLRQEEFRHLYSVAIAKAEEGAERIVQLETEMEQLEDEIVDDQSELTYLKLKLRILEIQTLPYVPIIEADKLAEGIRRWKLDWADVDTRFRVRRRRKKLSVLRLSRFSSDGDHNW